MKKSLSGLSLGLLLLLCALSSAFAAEEARDDAKASLQTAVDSIMSVLKDPAMADPASRPTLLDQIEDIAYTIFDFEEFSARTVGPAWRSFDDSQKTRFNDAFADMLRALYLDKLSGYSGEEIVYGRETRSTRGDRAEIETAVNMQGKAVPVAYRMVRKEDGWKIYDVIIEQISLVQNYRTQFGEIASRQGAEGLIALVEQKAAEIRAGNAQPGNQQ